jgi:hypothetical protein
MPAKPAYSYLSNENVEKPIKDRIAILYEHPYKIADKDYLETLSDYEVADLKAFEQPAQRAQRWYRNNGMDADIYPIYGEQDSTVIKNAVKGANKVALLGHAGSIMGGIPASRLVKYMNETPAEDCIMGSCNSGGYASNDLNKRFNLFGKDRNPWYGVVPKAKTEAELWYGVQGDGALDKAKVAGIGDGYQYNQTYQPKDVKLAEDEYRKILDARYNYLNGTPPELVSHDIVSYLDSLLIKTQRMKEDQYLHPGKLDSREYQPYSPHISGSTTSTSMNIRNIGPGQGPTQRRKEEFTYLPFDRSR